MKKNIFLFIFLLVSAFTFADKPKTETIKIKSSAICEQCKETIEKKLAFTRGVVESSVDLDSKDKIITVIFNPKKTTADKIRKSISQVGYDADGILADPIGYDKLEACCKKGGMRE